MGCKNICERYKVKKSILYRMPNGHVVMGYYDKDNLIKRCTVCACHIKWVGKDCPCCNMRLRTIPRAGRYKPRVKNMRPRVVINN